MVNNEANSLQFGPQCQPRLPEHHRLMRTWAIRRDCHEDDCKSRHLWEKLTREIRQGQAIRSSRNRDSHLEVFVESEGCDGGSIPLQRCFSHVARLPVRQGALLPRSEI